MDKVLSARIDEAVAKQLGVLAEALGTTKKDILERAIRSFSEQVDEQAELDVFRRTCGAWQRDEAPEETARHAREVFRRGLERHQR